MIRRLFILVVLLISLFPLYSAAADWWDGLEITGFVYEGLQNVKESDVNKLIGGYIGETYSDVLFSEINSLLYAQPWLSFVYADALDDGEGNLLIQFNFFENLKIEDVVFTGNEHLKTRVLLDNQEYSKGGFFTPGRTSFNASVIKDYYLSQGYLNAEVSSDYEENTEQNTVVINYYISEGVQYKVRDIVFEGNTNIASKEITKVLTQKKKNIFNSANFLQSNIEIDKSAIVELYASNGYPDAKIVDVKVDVVEEEKNNVVYTALTYVIEEGDKWTFGNITYSGNKEFSDSDIDSVITVLEGDPYNIDKIRAQYEEIASLYYDNGYIRSVLTLEEDRDDINHIISFNIKIVEGEQSIVESIIISGLIKSKDYVMRREVTLAEGDVFSRSKLIKSQQNLLNTGLISAVKADLLYGETENGVIIEFTIEEAEQMEIQFGATFGGTVDEFPISAFVQWSDKNIFGTGRRLSISSTISPDTQSATISLNDNWVKNYRWSNTISFTFEHSEKENTLQRGAGSGYYDGRDEYFETWPLGYSSSSSWYSSDYPIYPTSAYLMTYQFWRFVLGYSTGYTFQFDAGNLTLSAGTSFGINRAYYDSAKYDPYEYLITKYHAAWQWSNKISFGITWDGRDLIYDTTKGYLLSLQYTYAGGFLGGLSNYNRISASAAGYISLFSYTNDEGVKRNLVLSLSSSVSFMLDQFWNNTDKDGWGWYNAKQGATKYEMLYIDGMNIGRGFDVKFDLAFLWNNEITLAFPIVNQVLAVEAFVSATAAVKELSYLSSFYNLTWYFAAGIGMKMIIPGFPLGLYIVKNATWSQGNGFEWESGYLFSNGSAGSGLKLVLAITTSLY